MPITMLSQPRVFLLMLCAALLLKQSRSFIQYKLEYGPRTRTTSMQNQQTSNMDNSAENGTDTVPVISLDRKLKQKRRKFSEPRRPSFFWAEIGNVEEELRLFWESVNVSIDSSVPPPIPNEALLNHFERHGLRYAIANIGGRDIVAERLGGARLIPGKWCEACATSKEVQCLLKADNPAGAGLSQKVPPLAPYLKRSLMKVSDSGNKSDVDSLRFQAGERWAQKPGRNPRGYWDEAKVVDELHNYLAVVKEEKGRPSVWMARPSEFTNEGRDDLKQAISRYGGSKYICKVAKLIPYKEWRYFESILDLHIELQKYLILHENGREDLFPKMSAIRNNGHERLYDLIMEFGGRKMIAAKLNMKFQSHTNIEVMKGLSFGRFSLGFAIRLMTFMRSELLKQNPPLENTIIQMPTVKDLIQKGEIDLAKDLIKYGGHECIARRLNLRFNEKEAKRDAIARARMEISETLEPYERRKRYRDDYLR